MITPSFGLTATERVLPKLALDFTTASLDSRITFARTTSASNPATYTNSSGVITAATNNQPRFDYDPVTLACKGLLIEESRSNLLTYSEAFDNAAWSTGGTILRTADAATSPDGTVNADKIYESTGLSNHQISQLVSMTSGTSYTFSVYAKAAERTTVQITFSSAAIPYKANFNLSTGSLGSVDAQLTAKIEDAGNGWYRCSATGTSAATGSYGGIVVLTTSATAGRLPSYQGDGTSGIYVYGAQLEAGAFATSYVPTTTTALTRNADVAVMTGTNFSDWFNASEGTFAVEHIAPQGLGAVGGSYGLYASNSGGTNVIGVSQAISGTHRLCNYVQASASQATITGASLTPGQTYKFCSGYKTNNFTVAQNGAATQTDLSGTVPSSIDRLMIGSALTNQQLNSHIKTIEYWPHQLTSNEVQAFSKG